MKPSKQYLAKVREYSKFRHEVADHLKEKHGHLACLKCFHDKPSGDMRVDIDHIVRHAGRKAFKFDLENCQILCRTHHIEKTGLDYMSTFDNEKWLRGQYGQES